MTDRNCNTCENYKPSDRYYDTNGVHKTEPEHPEIRALNREQCEWIESHRRGYGYIKGRCSNAWKYYCYLLFNRCDINTYGLPVTDPFWDEWEEMHKLKDPFVGKKVWWTGRYSKTGSRISKARFVQCTENDHDTRQNYRIVVDGIAEWVDTSELSITPPPLVKVWAIDKSGSVSKYKFYAGEDNPIDWDRIKRENKGAEAIVVMSDTPVTVPGTICKLEPKESYVLFNDKDCLGYYINSGDGYYYSWFSENPVESIRAEIIKRNAPKFKMGDWVKPLNSTSYPYQITDEALLSLANGLPHRLATRSDFEVKRVGPDGLEHTWLAVELANTEYIAIHNDGARIASVHKNDTLFKTFINLPVCPAEVK